MREVSVEEYLKKLVEQAGGICEKHVAPGRIGVPDRLITWPWGDMDLVETKAPTKKARKTQTNDHEERAKRGVPVYLLDTQAKVREYAMGRTPFTTPAQFYSVPLG